MAKCRIYITLCVVNTTPILVKRTRSTNTMKTPRIYIGALAVFCIAALVIGSAGAAAMMQNGTGTNFKNTGGKGHMNSMANMTQLKEFRTAHPDGYPAFANCTGKGPMTGGANGERMLLVLDNLTAQGYDVTAIHAAVTSGDYKTAITLMQEFRTAHPDAFPARGEGAGKGPTTGPANGERIDSAAKQPDRTRVRCIGYQCSSNERGLQDRHDTGAGIPDCTPGCIPCTR